MAETVALVSVIGTVAVSIISEIRDSRCTHIETPCCSCDRTPTEVFKGDRKIKEIPVITEKEKSNEE